MRDLYQQLIIDHGRSPRNFGELKNANHMKEGFNPLCGDKVTVYAIEKDGVIDDIKFDGCGCAISMASASLMTQALKGKKIDDAVKLFGEFHDVVVGNNKSEDNENKLGKLIVLAGVAEYPARVKCAMLCWHTMIAALNNTDTNVTTE